MSDRWTLGAVGDVFLNQPGPSAAFDHVRPILQDVDIFFGNCEGVYTDVARSVPTAGGFRLISPLSNVKTLGRAGFHVMSCANNHTVDSGHEGLTDTLESLQLEGIETPGAGLNLAEARRPKNIERGDMRVAFLAYTSVYPAGYEARELSPGVAAMRVHSHYFVHPDAFGRVEPGADPEIRTFPFREDLEMFERSIHAARADADVVVVSFHWGKSTSPGLLTDYERIFGRAAIDAGCDVVLGHHHHMLRGVELYRGKPIFYGLGHFAFDMPGLVEALGGSRLAQLRAFGEYAIYPREGYPFLPFHPDSRMTMIGLCVFNGQEFTQAAFVPCLINAANQPEPLEQSSEEARSVIEYMKTMTGLADLTTDYRADGPVVGGISSIAIS